jgi:predicted dehydrogenase
MKKLRVGVSGAGGEARLYMDRWNSTRSELVVVQDIDEAKVREQADRHDCEWTLDFDRLLEDGIDIVDVSTPNHLHASQAIVALEANKHVFCQKPMAPTVTDCQRMIDTAKETGVRLGIYMSAMNDPFFHEIRRMVEDGFFGFISSVATRGAHRGGYEAQDDTAWRGSLEKTGGGAFIQLTIHGVNLLQWILGEDVVEIAGFSDNRLCKHSIGGDDLTHAVGRFKSGIMGSFEGGYSAEGDLMAIHGTKGSFVQTAGRRFLWSEQAWKGDLITYEPAGGKTMTLLDASEIGAKSTAFMAACDQHEAFLSALTSGAPFTVPAEAGMRDVAIAKAIYRASDERRTVRVAEVIEE